MALLGAILPVWGYHRDPPAFVAVGNYFLSLAAGLGASPAAAWWLLGRRSLSFLLVFSCSLCFVALAYLALVSPPAPASWRMAGLVVLGLGGGLLNVALFHSISHSYSRNAARTVNHGGLWYGAGCLAATLLVIGTFYVYPPPGIVLLMALVPGIFAGVYAMSGIPSAESSTPLATFRQALDDFRSVRAILFALLLFFQFGNEWSIAGWLPLLLIRRVGLSPIAALLLLALYWLFLIAGRFLAATVRSRVHHGWLLGSSMVAALLGCILLFFTNNGFGAASGVLLIGSGYATIYPLVAEAIEGRFPHYHPGFFNGIFSLAMLGGLLAPAILGYAAAKFGVGVVMGVPFVGTCMVLVLVLSMWLEARLAR
jgi:hypothetical protein